jgi:hypothetical protein
MSIVKLGTCSVITTTMGRQYGQIVSRNWGVGRGAEGFISDTGTKSLARKTAIKKLLNIYQSFSTDSEYLLQLKYN